jgi:hypothetical protein
MAALVSAAWRLPVPAMEMRAEDYLPMAAELKKSLNLNANQQTLWRRPNQAPATCCANARRAANSLQAALLAGPRARMPSCAIWQGDR